MEPKQPSKPSLHNIAQDFRDLFGVLVPSSTVSVTDAFGGEHVLRGMTSARNQALILREFEAISKIVDISNIDRSNLPNLASAILSIAQHDGVLDHLAAAFAHPHEGAIVRARRNAERVYISDRTEDEPLLESVRTAAREYAAELGVADLFPVEELAAGLVPFFVRLVDRLLGMVDPGGAPATTES